jgi:hypothetical protein
MNSPHPKPFSPKRKASKSGSLALWERVRVRARVRVRVSRAFILRVSNARKSNAGKSNAGKSNAAELRPWSNNALGTQPLPLGKT